MSTQFQGSGVGLSEADVVVGGLNAACSIVYPAPGPGKVNVLSHILLSFNHLYVESVLQVLDGTAVVLDCDVESMVGGPIVLNWSACPLVGTTNRPMTITVSAPGVADVRAKLTVRHWVG